MDFSSETESDSDVSVTSLIDVNDIGTPHPTLSAFPPDISLAIPLIDLDDVMREILKLSNQDLDSDFKAAQLLDELQRSADTLISFVTHIPDLFLGKDVYSVLMTVVALIDITFLDRLYLYRKIFRDLAICAPGVHRATMILTWVDELLARLHPVILTLAPGPYLPDYENTGIAQSIQSQKRDDILRATIQLPEKWADIHIVIGSADFSPATKRIATSLLFAAYVIQPQLKRVNVDSWPNVGPERTDILASLYFATSHMSLQMHSPSKVIDPLPQRVMAAMLIVLFSMLDYKTTESHETFHSPKLRPEGFRHMLYLLQLVMAQPTDSFMPVEHLDAPQTILLRWGNVVPWSWTTWDDQRIANTEYLPCLTATWLYHLNEPLITNLEHLHSKNSVISNFRTSLFADIKAASSMILQILQNTVQTLGNEGDDRDTLYPVLLSMLSKLCWAIIQFLESNALRNDYAIEARTPEYAKLMIITYTLLGTSSEDLFEFNRRIINTCSFRMYRFMHPKPRQRPNSSNFISIRESH
ncbi:hypothetical protein BJ912DRAFT_207243 [Pholiota molesta]|nr:hypothetical protein BJ912DRAFT_207243 [Pholiota molesta]